MNNTEVSLARTFSLTERYKLVFRADAVNVFNRTSFSDGGIQKSFGTTYLPANANDPAQVARAGTTTSPTFGSLDVRSVGMTPRYLQFALRLTF